MKHKIHKVFFNYEKEEKWLNDMAAKGYLFTNYSFLRYTFDEGTPGEYIYRIELLKELPSHIESKAYIKFMEETGAECIATYFRWAFFRRKACLGPFELFTSYESKVIHYKRVVLLTGVVTLMNFTLGLSNFNIDHFLNEQRTFNTYLSIFNFLVVFILAPVTISYLLKIRKIKKDKTLYDI